MGVPNNATQSFGFLIVIYVWIPLDDGASAIVATRHVYNI